MRGFHEAASAALLFAGAEASASAAFAHALAGKRDPWMALDFGCVACFETTLALHWQCWQTQQIQERRKQACAQFKAAVSKAMVGSVARPSQSGQTRVLLFDINSGRGCSVEDKIIVPAFVFAAEGLVGFCDTLEFFFSQRSRLLVLPIAVGMISQNQLAISTFYVLLGGVVGNAENFIVVFQPGNLRFCF